MLSDDSPVANPATQTEGKAKFGNSGGRSIGPESETRAGPEAPDKALVTPAEPAEMEVSPKTGAGVAASDPPIPPGQPPDLPYRDPDKPPPIEEPPRPIPVPPNDPPAPIVALSYAKTVWCG